nr:A70 [uncultured bacterium]
MRQLGIEDRLAVQDLIILYGHLHDSKQSHRVADEIFCADATIDFGSGVISGRDAIHEFFSGFTGIMGTSHNISNFIVEGEGDSARCQSHCLAWHWFERPDVDGRPSLHASDALAVGGYQDDLRREPQGWRIAHRRTVQFGTGLGVGEIAPALRPIFEGGLGRLPEWP